ncbi:hypothetical protein ELY21_11050 [Legionella sp. km535]|uniref:hypothetical protein n=1 Tax=Legionella sp. km535 TaxID=2498107 RepID=UPI000F8E030B|nr:hypothetical protein [Legionella sp. km535]RUR17674.1 hypothetical protein ELY21_11050 [Legionella sp. km535]
MKYVKKISSIIMFFSVGLSSAQTNLVLEKECNISNYNNNFSILFLPKESELVCAKKIAIECCVGHGGVCQYWPYPKCCDGSRCSG